MTQLQEPSKGIVKIFLLLFHVEDQYENVSPAWGVSECGIEIQTSLKVIPLLATMRLCSELTHLCVKFIIQIWRVSGTRMFVIMSTNACFTLSLAHWNYFICEANLFIYLLCLDSPSFLLNSY